MKTLFKLLFIAILLFLISCSGKETDKNQTNTKFCLNDTLMKMISFDKAHYTKLVNEVNLIGKIGFNENNTVKVFPIISGTVTDVKVSLGDHVEKGQVLALVRSSEVASSENDMVTAQSNLEIARKSLASTTDMYKSGITSEKDYLSAQKDVAKAESELRKASQISKIYGSTKQSEYAVKAPVSGYIVEKKINANQQIRSDNSDNIFTVSNLKDVWVMANVYETDIPAVKLGQTAKITTLAYPDKVMIGKVDKVYNVLDPDTKTMKIRIQLDNTDNTLKPEMFANVSILYSTDSIKIAIPASAIIMDKSKNYVMVYNNKCDLQTREVNVYRTVNNVAYISSGIKANERVISKSGLLIYNTLNP